MKSDMMRYSNSVYLFPCIDVSEDLNSLKQLHVLLMLGRKPQIVFDERIIVDIATWGERYTANWFGDSVELRDPVTNHFIFIGFINNYLIGFGDLKFKFDEKNLKKFDIVFHTLTGIFKDKTEETENQKKNVEGFILTIPYKNYKSNFDLMRYFEGYKSGEADWGTIYDIFEPARTWKQNAPKIDDDNLEEVWDDSWVLYRLNMYNPEGPFQHRWITPCRHTNYQYDKLAMWDTLHIVEDLKWYKIDQAINLLEMQFGLFRESDGMMAQDRSCGGVLDGGTYNERIDGNNYARSQPPMWSYSFLELAKLIGRYDICGTAFERMAKNIRWWEQNRYFPEYKLFGYDMKPAEIGNESGLDNSPRFYHQWNGKKWKKASKRKERKLIAVDLNAQMADYYQNLGVIAMMKQDERSNDYFAKAERLIERMQKYLWDDNKKFFFDYDVDQEAQQPMYTAAAFWTLFGGCVLKGNLEDFVAHMTNPNKFWTEFPVPSIALNSKFFEPDMWSGATWLSQNYWFIVGLRRYNFGDLAAQLAKKCLKYLTSSYINYHKFYEFYNPVGLSQKVLKRKGKQPGPPADYVGHLPVHSMFYYGMLGAEVLDESLSFIPYWDTVQKDMKIQVYYNNKKEELDSIRNETKLLQILRDS